MWLLLQQLTLALASSANINAGGMEIELNVYARVVTKYMDSDA